MDILIRYGFSIEEINNMMNSNPDINDLSDQDVVDIIEILTSVGCGEKHIKNILITNPFVLTNEITEIKKVIVKLLDIGLDNLAYLFDTNPFLLNIDFKEIDYLAKKKSKEGLSNEEILNYFYYESNRML